VATNPKLSDRLAAIGQAVLSSTPAEFSAELVKEREFMKSIMKLIGAKPTL
jgi:hypothetical protein